MNLKLIRNYSLVAVAALLVGRYVLQPKQEVKEVVKTVEVIKYVKEEKKKSKTEIKERVNTDGSKETTTTITEDTTTKETGKEETKISQETQTKTGHKITLGVIGIKTMDDLSRTDVGGIVAVPVFGNIKAIGFGATSSNSFQLGAGLGMEF